MMVEMNDSIGHQSQQKVSLQCHECSKAETQTEHFHSDVEKYSDFESWTQCHDWSGASTAEQ
jgi:hypothetical protein